MKDYNEIAKKIFERRDKYLAKQKKKKQIINKTVPVICCCLVLIMSLALLKSGFLGDDIKIIEQIQNGYTNEQKNPFEDEKTPPANDGGENNPDNSELPIPNDTPKENEPSDNTEHFIDSIDKMNFYSAKKIIEEQSFLPVVANESGITVNLSNTDIAYDKEFSIYKITYFNICINSADSFLARKLGGTGLVEVVVVDTDILNVYKMLTFKLGNNYYTCLMSEVDGMNYTKNSTDEFNTTRYTSGFDVLKNNEQGNYSFSVRYEGSQVVGFESTPFNSATAAQGSEEITFVDDYCVVIFTNETVTISQLESYVRKFNSGDLI